MNEIDRSTMVLAEMYVSPRSTLDDVTVVIPTVGRPTLAACLQAIVEGTVWPAHIIVVDQGENDAVVDWVCCLREAGISTTHLLSTQRSPASARNRGIEQVETEFVAAIDDDCLAEKDWLEKMEMHLGQNPTAIVTGRVNPANSGFVPSIVTSDVPAFYERPRLRNGGNVASGNMGFAVGTARRVGSFDEDPLFRHAAEDNDWAYRALRAGVPIIYAPEVIVFHLDWRDKAQLTATYRVYAWSEGAFYGKHLRRGDWSMVFRTAIHFYRGVKLVINGTVNADYGRRVDGYARITRLLPGLIAGLRHGEN